MQVSKAATIIGRRARETLDRRAAAAAADAERWWAESAGAEAAAEAADADAAAAKKAAAEKVAAEKAAAEKASAEAADAEAAEWGPQIERLNKEFGFLQVQQVCVWVVGRGGYLYVVTPKICIKYRKH